MQKQGVGGALALVLGWMMWNPAVAGAQAFGPASGGGDNSGPDLVRVSLYAGPRLGGSAQFSFDGDSETADMAVGGSLGVRLEVPVARYFVIGGFFDFASLQLDFGDGFEPADRLNVLNVGLWLKVRALVELQSAIMEIYLGVPVGLSVAVSTEEDVDNDLGYGLGALGGVQVHLNQTLGLFVEAGFHRDSYKVGEEFGETLRVSFLQASVHGGVSFGF
jgi:hypothetical protein